MIDYYNIMEISRFSTHINLKKQYYNLSKKYHPDKYYDKNKFKSINEAYHILSNNYEKEKYDLLYDLYYYIPILKEFYIDNDIIYELYKLINDKKEIKLMKLLFQNLPNKNNIQNNIIKFINKNYILTYFKNKKYIDLIYLNDNFILKFNISIRDLNKLFIFIINGQSGYYYLFIRNFFDIISLYNNHKSKLIIQFIILLP